MTENSENVKKFAKIILKRATDRETDNMAEYDNKICFWEMIYTIKNIVDNNLNIVYNDGITTWILNAKGKKGTIKKH